MLVPAGGNTRRAAWAALWRERGVGDGDRTAAGILEEYKNRMEYIKPSKKKSEKRNAAIRRQRKLDSENF